MKKIPFAICLLVAFAQLAGPVSAAPPARASPTAGNGAAPAPGRAASGGVIAALDVIETSATGVASTARFEAALTLDQRRSLMHASAADARYEIKTAWHSQKTGGPLFHVELEQLREQRAPTRFELRIQVPRGARTVLADVTRPDGSRFTLAVTLR
jgi:hypothetical protein